MHVSQHFTYRLTAQKAELWLLEDVNVLTPEPVNILSHGKRDLAGLVKVKDLEMEDYLLLSNLAQSNHMNP